jgi:hypothetical protein
MAEKTLSQVPPARNTKPQYPDPFTQGQAEYLSQASLISRDNIELQRRGQVNDNLHLVSKILRDAVFAQAMVLHAEWKRAEAKRHKNETPQEIPATLGTPEATPADLTPLDPFFRRRDEANAIRRAQAPSHRQIWQLYFDRYGCLVCQTRTEPYASDGMCHRCHARISARRRGLEQGKRVYPIKPRSIRP